MSWAWGITPNPVRSRGRSKHGGIHKYFWRRKQKSPDSKQRRRRRSKDDLCTHLSLGLLIEKLEEELKLCQTSTSGKQRLKDKSKQLVSLKRQLEIILHDVSDQDSVCLIESVSTPNGSLTREQLLAQLAEKDDQIRNLKAQSEKRYQQIQSLEEQQQGDREQAKQFERDYRVEAEENHMLRTENQELRDQLDSGFGVCSDDESAVEHGILGDDKVKKVVTGLKARVKGLNDDVMRLREHSKEQSRQILKYKQQEEVSHMMEGQLEAMERIQHEAKEECYQKHAELQATTQELQRLQNEKEVLDKEYAQLQQNLMSMGDLSSQLMEAKRTSDELKLKLEASQRGRNEMKQGKTEACDRNSDVEREVAQGNIELDRLADQREHEDLKQNYTVVCNQLAEQQESLSALEQANETLRQDIGAKSSQVKQYAKEVDRLKKQLEASKHLSTSVAESENKCFEDEQRYRKAEDEIVVLSRKSAQYLEQIKQLEKENTRLRNLLMSQRTPATSQAESKHDEVHTPVTPSVCVGPLQKVNLNMIHPVSPLTGETHSKMVQVGCLVEEADDIERDGRKPEQQRKIKRQYQNGVAARNQCGSYDKKEQVIYEGQSKHAMNNSSQASDRLEDSFKQFENPLQREVDDEIHQHAAEVIQEVSGRRQEAKTDPKRPFDPNLVCPMCRKQFRIGEIQKFRRHVNTCTGTSDD